MVRKRDEVLEGYAEYEAACAALRGVLRQHETFVRRLRRKLEQGKSLRESLDGTAFAYKWARVAEHLDRAEKARHRARLASFVLLQEEGVSVAEMARMWQLSRQLVSRTMQKIAG
jgi:Fic family protein